MMRNALVLAAAVALLVLGGCSGDDEGPRPENHPPVVNAGPDRIAGTGQAVTLQGDGTDPDGDALQLGWLLAIAPPYSQARLAASTGPETIFVPDLEGVYVVALYGWDGELESEPDLVPSASAPARGAAPR